MKLGKLTAPEIQRFYNELGRTGHKVERRDKKTGKVTVTLEPLATKSVRNIHGILTKALNTAVDVGYLKTNPAERVTLPRVEKKEIHPLDDAQVSAFYKAAADDEYCYLLRLIPFTGLREAEAMGLLDTDLDRKAKTISITRSVYFEYNRPYVKPPKSAAGVRVTPVPDFLLKLLPKGKKGKPLFPGKDGGYMTAGEFERMWIRWQKMTGLKLTAHQIRHGYATILYEGGIEPKDMQGYLGHAQLSTTMDIYTHIRDAHKAATNKKVSDALSKI